MFDEYALRGSIWKSRVNSALGSVFLGSCALWAALVMIQVSWGTNPLADALAAAIYARTNLPE